MFFKINFLKIKVIEEFFHNNIIEEVEMNDLIKEEKLPLLCRDKIFKSMFLIYPDILSLFIYDITGIKLDNINLVMNELPITRKNEKFKMCDFIIKDNNYFFVFDRNGKSMWGTNKFSYGGKTMQIVMVLSPKVKREYLAFLRDIKVSYIIVDNLLDSLKKMKELFGVKTLVLTGGATINGAFHKEGLIDELSLVIAPYIEGNHDFKGYAELDGFINHKYIYKSIKPLGDGGIHLMFERQHC